ncbi:MAG: 30S ribosomal protein S15 [Candidatus Marinimicrobia bacterium]|nr:30S ribosomal protein S15 [Candidatus Neomarinimicrobiota bacterium]
MSLTKEVKRELVEKFGSNPSDTGRTEVQIAILTKRIQRLTEHFKKNKKDFGSIRGLYKLVGRRKRLLEYLKRKDIKRYENIVNELNLRK